jgi:hypothetical protein
MRSVSTHSILINKPLAQSYSLLKILIVGNNEKYFFPQKVHTGSQPFNQQAIHTLITLACQEVDSYHK